MEISLHALISPSSGEPERRFDQDSCFLASSIAPGHLPGRDTSHNVQVTHSASPHAVHNFGNCGVESLTDGNTTPDAVNVLNAGEITYTERQPAVASAEQIESGG